MVISKSFGFTLNMAHYVKQAVVEGDFILTKSNTKLRTFIASTYELGFVFGSFLAVGNMSLVIYKKSTRGSVSWYLPESRVEVFDKIHDCLFEAFNLESVLLQKSKKSYQMLCYSKPLAELLAEFGKKENRHLPEKYLVSNKEFLRGIKEGIEILDGQLPDTREVINPRAYSQQVSQLYNLLNMWYNEYT